MDFYWRKWIPVTFGPFIHLVPKQVRNVLRNNQVLEESFHSVGLKGV
jgi:hypothetical protein